MSLSLYDVELETSRWFDMTKVRHKDVYEIY